jgi:hypothetical protein
MLECRMRDQRLNAQLGTIEAKQLVRLQKGGGDDGELDVRWCGLFECRATLLNHLKTPG